MPPIRKEDIRVVYCKRLTQPLSSYGPQVRYQDRAPSSPAHGSLLELDVRKDVESTFTHDSGLRELVEYIDQV